MVTKTSQVAEVLAREIRSGKFKSGERLPSMRALSARFNVSTKVLYDASGLLAKQGLIERSTRSGLFIPEALRQGTLCGLITSTVYGTMNNYYESLMMESAEANCVTMISLPSRRSVESMLEKAPLLVFADLNGFEMPYPILQKLTMGMNTVFFHRFEWPEAKPDSAVLSDWIYITEQTLRYFLDRGHKKIVFLSHEHQIKEFKRLQMEEAARRVGLEFDTPEFQWFGRQDLELNPERVARIFGKDPPSAIFARSDMLLSETLAKVSVFFPAAGAMDKVGMYDMSYSKQSGHEYSTWHWDWNRFWKMAFAHQSGVEYYRPEFIRRQAD